MRLALLALLAVFLLSPFASAQSTPATQPFDELALDSPVYACACGCGVFDVATSSMLPGKKGGMFYAEYDYMDQNHNRAGNRESPAEDNDDKELRTNFFTAGAQYMFNRRWGVQVDVPIWQRYFKTLVGPGDLATSSWTALGDLRLRGIYTGWSEDMSIGTTFGLKLPTGDFRHDLAVVDRDSQIGAGSTDLLLGGFFRHNLSFAPDFTAFAQLDLDIPFLTQDQYRPGIELDSAAGVYYDSFRLGKIAVSPVGQIIVSHRASDGGAFASFPKASGYDRVLLSPGLEFHMHPFMLYADVELPVYQHYTHDQLAASVLFKVILSYDF